MAETGEPSTTGGKGETAVVVEDDEPIRTLVAATLCQIGLDVVTVSDGIAGVQAVRQHSPAIVTLDINMPGIDGFEAAQRIRALSNAYIIMLTARADEVDTLQGLAAGADDFITKPFRPRELRARVEAMLRRPRAITTPTRLSARGRGVVAVSNALSHNGVVLDPDTRIVRRDGSEIILTHREFELLLALMKTRRRVRSKSDLVLTLRGVESAGSGYVSESDRRGIEVHIANLRKKLGDRADDPRIIETVRGVGYRLTAVEG
jgi:DNA-binding response OmpR family regulator